MHTMSKRGEGLPRPETIGSIDFGRVVWDPEYRRRVIKFLNRSSGPAPANDNREIATEDSSSGSES